MGTWQGCWLPRQTPVMDTTHFVFPSFSIDTYAFHFTLFTFPFSTNVYEPRYSLGWWTQIHSISIVIFTGCEIYSVCEMSFLPSSKMVMWVLQIPRYPGSSLTSRSLPSVAYNLHHAATSEVGIWAIDTFLWMCDKIDPSKSISKYYLVVILLNVAFQTGTGVFSMAQAPAN